MAEWKTDTKAYKKTPNSFLYGTKQNQDQILPDNLKTMKEGLQKQN